VFFGQRYNGCPRIVLMDKFFDHPTIREFALIHAKKSKRTGGTQCFPGIDPQRY